MKRPKEIRKAKFRTCKFCGITSKASNIYVLKALHLSEEDHVCEDCFKKYCEVCGKLEDIVFHKRIIQDVYTTQICNHCYTRACDDIIKLDADYGIRRIGKPKEGI